MRNPLCTITAALVLAACGGPKTPAQHASAEAGGAGAESAAQPSEFKLNKTNEDPQAEPAKKQPASKIKGNATHAALKFIVVDKDKGPLSGIVIALTAPDGNKLYTDETTGEGYTELLVPKGQKYEVVYLSLGRKEIAASVPVSDEPNQNIKLTLRYKRWTPPPRPRVEPTSSAEPETPAEPEAPAGFILDAVTFDSGKSTVRQESFEQLDGVAEYLTHKKSARLEISGHTDNVGNPKVNKALSLKRAQACRDYLISKGVDGARIEAVGFGDERPIASNDNEAGRQQNRRIEATEL